MDPTASPLFEFDPSRHAVIEPISAITPFPIPAAVVVCFFRDAVERLRAETATLEVGHLECEMGRYPVIEVDWAGARIGIAPGGVGAPLAAGWLEELIALGARRLIVAGGAGCLVPELALGHVVVPTSAVRDEGTSHHYLPPGRVVEPRTWTTDAYYRETRDRVRRRVAEGCLTVEMEASALFAVARFRGVSLAQMLYAGDDLSGEVWDPREWTRHASGRDLLLRLALEALADMESTPPTA
jgi:uridine phosphorylase